jgi:hypothetical protein
MQRGPLQPIPQCRVERYAAARVCSGRREVTVACSIRRIGGVVLTALTLSAVASVQPAAAQGLFDALFGGFQRRAPQPAPHASSFADPFGMFGGEPRRASGESYGGGGGTVYCVRTCDGRYFPLQRHAGATPAELCKSFCPAAKTMVFSGSKIDTAVAPNGARYADLDNAFAYRDKVTDSCSCNGKDGLGLARVEAGTDPTLRPGDIVATDGGLSMYNGRNRNAEFTPISSSSGEWARRLAEVKVDPAPPSEKIEPVANDEPKPRKARQASRQASRQARPDHPAFR